VQHGERHSGVSSVAAEDGSSVGRNCSAAASTGASIGASPTVTRCCLTCQPEALTTPAGRG
jgi:hypothetical protein